MKTQKKLFNIALVLFMIFNLSTSSGAVSSQQLPCNIVISAELIGNELKISAKNNTNKDVVEIKYLKQVYHRGEIFGGLTNYSTINKPYSDDKIILKKKSEGIVEHKSEYIPLHAWKDSENVEFTYSDITMKLYFCYVEFSDGTKWGEKYGSIDYITNNLNCIIIQCSEPLTTDATVSTKIITEENNKTSSIVGMVLFVLIVVLIVVRKKQKNSKLSKHIYTPPGKSEINCYPLDNSTVQDTVQKGEEGERHIAEIIDNAVTDYNYILKNVYLTKEDGDTTEIDVILIHETGIYVIESKNYSGWVFGNETDKYWTQSLYGGVDGTVKNRFYNPVLQNRNHVKNLKNHLGTDYKDIPYYSITVFGEKTDLKKITIKSDDAAVITLTQLEETIKAYITLARAKHKHISEEQMKSIFDKLYELTQVSDEVKEKHIDEIKKFNELSKSNINSNETNNPNDSGGVL